MVAAALDVPIGLDVPLAAEPVGEPDVAVELVGLLETVPVGAGDVGADVGVAVLGQLIGG